MEVAHKSRTTPAAKTSIESPFSTGDHTMTRVLIVCLILFSATHPAVAADSVFRQPPAPEVNPWAESGIPADFQFGAYYTRKNVDESWHRQSRTDEYADVSVRFGNGPEELVFWRGSSYLPYWTTGETKVSLEEIIPRSGDGPAERPDKVNRYSRVRIIQSTPERVVVHWRYMPNMPENVGPENLPDQTRMVDEYFVVFPDRSVVRAVLAGQPRYEDWRKAAPGRVFRYQLTDTGIEEQPAESADTALMLDVMGFAGEKPRTVVAGAASNAARFPAEARGPLLLRRRQRADDAGSGLGHGGRHRRPRGALARRRFRDGTADGRLDFAGAIGKGPVAAGERPHHA